MKQFKNRYDSGEKLASLLSFYKEKKETLVIGLARGGIVVAAAIAEILRLPLDCIVPRKLGAPYDPELAIGAIVGQEILLNQTLIEELEVSKDYLQKEIQRQQENASQKLALYRKEIPTLPIQNKTILLIDDGLATGATMEASFLFLQKEGAKKIVVAIPISPPEILVKLQQKAEVFCFRTEEHFLGISAFYESFEQVSDQEVLFLLKKNRKKLGLS